MVKVKAIEVDVRTGKKIEKEIDLTPVEEEMPEGIDLSKIKELEARIKHIEEKLGIGVR